VNGPTSSGAGASHGGRGGGQGPYHNRGPNAGGTGWDRPSGNGGGARPSLLASQRPRMGMGGSKYGANPTTATIVRNPSSYGRADSRDRSPPRSLDRVASASDGGQWRGDEREEGEAGEVRTRRDSRGDSRFGGGGGGWDKPQPPAPAPAPAPAATATPTEEGELPPAPAPAPIARQASAPAATAATPEESPAPAKRKKLGWGQGLARGKSLPTPLAGAGAGGDDRIPTPSLDGQPPLPFGPPPGSTGGGPGLDGGSSNPYDISSFRGDANRTPPLPSGAPPPDARKRDPFIAVDTPGGVVSAPSPWGHSEDSLPGSAGGRGVGGGGAVDPIARAAAAKAAKAEAAARKEMMRDIELKKASILEKMEETDAAIGVLERDIAESEDKGENDREQVEAQRTHEDARLRRELEGARARVQHAEKAATRAEARAEEREKHAEEIASGVAQEMDDDELARAAEAAARAVQRMLAGREPRHALVKRVFDRNKSLAAKSHLGLKTTCGLPLPHEHERVAVDEIAARNVAAEAAPERAAIKDAVVSVLRRRGAHVADKELTLAVTYLKRREMWKMRVLRAAHAKLEKEKKEQGSSSGRGRGGRASMADTFGTVRSDYEQELLIRQLQNRERLKTLTKLPAMVLDPEEKRLAVFRTRNALVEDPYGEMEQLKKVRPWTPEEKKIFHEKFASYGKNFKRIATFIDGRTTADCVVYYYQRQKTDDGFRGRRKALAKKRRAYAEAQRMTGGAWKGPHAAQAVAAQAQAAKAAAKAKEEEEARRGALGVEARQERAALAAAARAEKKAKEKKKAKAAKAAAEAVAANESEEEDDLPIAAPKKKSKGGGSGDKLESADDAVAATSDAKDAKEDKAAEKWTSKERARFLEELLEHGRDFKAVAAALPSKSATACKAFFAKHKKSLGLEKIVEEHARNVKAKKEKEEKGDVAAGEAAAAAAAAAAVPDVPDVKTETKPEVAAPPSVSGAGNGGKKRKAEDADDGKDAKVAKTEDA
jgi:hypothetical protein